MFKLIKAKSPLPFAPYQGPISLEDPMKTPTEQSLKPIDLFDMKPYQRPQLPESEETKDTPFVTSPQLGGETPAKFTNDTGELQFDWPSEEIKRACEELFPEQKEWILPALNWIAPDGSYNDSEKDEPMQDIQMH